MAIIIEPIIIFILFYRKQFCSTTGLGISTYISWEKAFKGGEF